MVRIPPEGGVLGRVLASGTAEVGGFAASEGGESPLPGRPVWGRELASIAGIGNVQPTGGLDAAEMSGGGGPRVGTGGAGHESADGVQLNVTESGLPMGISWTQE